MAKEISTGFVLQPHNLTEAMNLAGMLAQSGMVPKAYINNPNATLVAMMMGSELGLNPIQSLQNIAVINGKPSIYADALLALVQNHPKFGGHEESFDETMMTATCTVWRKGDDKKHSVSFSQKDAVTAQLWGKSGPWSQYPKRMLMWRARGYALRDKFADALGGLITAEEAMDMPSEPKVISPTETALIAAPEKKKAAVTDDRLEVAIAKIAAGDYPLERLHATYELTEAQLQRLNEAFPQGGEQ